MLAEEGIFCHCWVTYIIIYILSDIYLGRFILKYLILIVFSLENPTWFPGMGKQGTLLDLSEAIPTMFSPTLLLCFNLATLSGNSQMLQMTLFF